MVNKAGTFRACPYPTGNRDLSSAQIKAFADVLFKRKPKYLGEAIPISGNGIMTEG